jgi:hypothetical protein
MALWVRSAEIARFGSTSQRLDCGVLGGAGLARTSPDVDHSPVEVYEVLADNRRRKFDLYFDV